MRKIKMKYWKRRVNSTENSKEFRTLENRTKEELAHHLFVDDCYSPSELQGFLVGFDQAKKMIIEFLRQKQMGYGEAFFFKLSDIEEIGNEKLPTSHDAI